MIVLIMLETPLLKGFASFLPLWGGYPCPFSGSKHNKKEWWVRLKHKREVNVTFIAFSMFRIVRSLYPPLRKHNSHLQTRQNSIARRLPFSKLVHETHISITKQCTHLSLCAHSLYNYQQVRSYQYDKDVHGFRTARPFELPPRK